MARKQKQHDRQFKLDALQYVREHPDLTQEECCKNLGISLSTLARWKQQYEDSNGDIPFRGSGNYSSDEQKEIARLKWELRDAQDAFDVLKKPSAFWEKTDHCYLYRGHSQGQEMPYLHLRNAEIPRRFTHWLSCFSQA